MVIVIISRRDILEWIRELAMLNIFAMLLYMYACDNTHQAPDRIPFFGSK